MPLEIREIVIKANLERNQTQRRSRELSEARIRQLEARVISSCMEKLKEKIGTKFDR